LCTDTWQWYCNFLAMSWPNQLRITVLAGYPISKIGVHDDLTHNLMETGLVSPQRKSHTHACNVYIYIYIFTYSVHIHVCMYVHIAKYTSVWFVAISLDWFWMGKHHIKIHMSQVLSSAPHWKNLFEHARSNRCYWDQELQKIRQGESGMSSITTTNIWRIRGYWMDTGWITHG